jgi:hypothetical protein
MAKRAQKVRVYGTDSNREVRHRLIEILYDRVALHKDKFIAPILHAEMQAMEVKKSGKVEHSDKTHDDQVFSYLMALYVWYDGKNLAEHFHIIKNTIKTDQDEDIEELDIEDALEAKEHVDLEKVNYDPESEIYQELEWLEANSVYINSEDFHTNEYLKTMEQRDMILASNKTIRDKYCEERGLDPSMYNKNIANGFTQLPDQLFMEDDNFNYDDVMINNDASNYHVPLAGNLADWWNKV